MNDEADKPRLTPGAASTGMGGQKTANLIGVQSASDFWLLDLSDSGEIVPMTPLTPVPLTRSWFSGIANIRGNLYAVTDFAAFQGNAPTPQNSSSRFLLIGTRYGNNAALLVTRMLGLKKADDLTAAKIGPDAPPWVEAIYTDKEGHSWKKLSVRTLLSDRRFMEIGL